LAIGRDLPPRAEIQELRARSDSFLAYGLLIGLLRIVAVLVDVVLPVGRDLPPGIKIQELRARSDSFLAYGLLVGLLRIVAVLVDVVLAIGRDLPPGIKIQEFSWIAYGIHNSLSINPAFGRHNGDIAYGKNCQK
jgi:hypothetical protein